MSVKTASVSPNRITADIVTLTNGVVSAINSDTTENIIQTITTLFNNDVSVGNDSHKSEIHDIPTPDLLSNINLVVNNNYNKSQSYPNNIITTFGANITNPPSKLINDIHRSIIEPIKIQTNKDIGNQLLSSTIVEKPVYHQQHSNRQSNHSSVRNIRRIKKNTDDDEYKDTRVDYDDDDDDIKKTKSSLFNFVKDIAFNLILTIPSLRTKLKPILNNTSLAINEIEKNFEDFKDELNKNELINIKKYVCVEGIRDKLNCILDISFKKIMEDGKIDIGDAPQFIQLVYLVIHSFNDINDGEVYKFAVSKEHVMLLLHYILKCVFCLTLDGAEEQMAISLLDTSFKLVKIKVCPLISKRWYHLFRKCWFWKKPKTLEDFQ